MARAPDGASFSRKGRTARHARGTPLTLVGSVVPDSRPHSRVFRRVRLFCDPRDCSPPGSSVRGVSQASTLEWGAASSGGPSRPRIEPAPPVSPSWAGGSAPPAPPGRPIQRHRAWSQTRLGSVTLGGCLTALHRRPHQESGDDVRAIGLAVRVREGTHRRGTHAGTHACPLRLWTLQFCAKKCFTASAPGWGRAGTDPSGGERAGGQLWFSLPPRSRGPNKASKPFSSGLGYC